MDQLHGQRGVFVVSDKVVNSNDVRMCDVERASMLLSEAKTQLSVRVLPRLTRQVELSFLVVDQLDACILAAAQLTLTLITSLRGCLEVWFHRGVLLSALQKQRGRLTMLSDSS